MEDQVPFKVYTYWNEEEKPEVRRFGIEKTVVTSFHYLNAKLQDVFPGLRNKSYTVSWKDEDDDDVTISSDNEIMIALSMQQRDLMKLYVHCKDKPQENCKIFVDLTGTEMPNSNLSHGGVICDGCESQVVGFRYKCTTCDDFDLCSRCEGAGMHPEHLMVRVPMPNMPRNNIRAALKRSRHILKAVASQVQEETKKIRRERSTERKRHGHSHGGGHSHSHGHRRGGDSEKHPRTHVTWLEIFGNYMNQFADLAGDVKIDVEKSKKTKEGDKKNQSDTKKEEKSTGNQTSCPFVENVDFQNFQKLLNTYLRDGDASPSTSTAKPETKSQDTANPGAKPKETVMPEATPQAQVNDVEMEKADAQSDKISVKSEASTSSEESKREGTPEVEKEKADGWTVISKEKDLSDAYENAAAGPPIGFNLPEEFQQHVKISEGQNLYPPLNVATAVLNPKETERPVPADQPQPAENTAPSAPTEKEDKTQTKKHHPLAHINAAIEQMICMGFSNEDGWLTQLLENKDGNIAAVLDLLTPVNAKK